jgi:hypothetical protein
VSGPGTGCQVNSPTSEVVTLRYVWRLHHVGLGARQRHKPIVLFVADRDVRIVTAEGELLRQLVLAPTRDYQRQSE